MYIKENVLEKRERVVYALRSLYLDYGYRNYRMNKFEEYDLYAQNKDFLVSDNVITFTDTDGKLLALKPDVTLSIIKNSTDYPERSEKVCYNENVYRVSKGSGGFKEILQSGVECFGKVGNEEVWETILLALKSLELISPDYVLSISCLDVLERIVRLADLNGKEEKELYSLISEKNLEKVVAYPKVGQTLKTLLQLNDPTKTASVLEGIEPNLLNEYKEFKYVLNKLIESEYKDKVIIDFSIVGDLNYYNGIVFKGYIKNLPREVLSGGRYDNLLKKMKRSSSAIGFAVYTNELEFADENLAFDDYVNVALPKGRLGEKVYESLAKIGYDCPQILEPNRKLMFENPVKKVRYFWVKPSDIAIYVERGAADLGIAGKDILDEYAPDVYELADLKLGKCKMAVAAPKDFVDDPSKTLRVATKFSAIARKFYQAKGRDIDIIHLNGSIEIAPLLGLSDVIVDIVETGRTLAENDLAVLEDVSYISARLIANKATFKFKSAAIEELRDKLLEKDRL